MPKIFKEITPLTANDLLITRHYPENYLDYPLHSHEDYEINLTFLKKDSYIRTIGNDVDEIEHGDLTLIFPDTFHRYSKNERTENLECPADVIVIQFSKSLPEWRFMHTSQMGDIFRMLSRDVSALEFSSEIIRKVKSKMLKLCSLRGFESAELFLSILNDLACATPDNVKIIGSCQKKDHDHSVERINKIISYVHAHYKDKITLKMIGELVGLSPSSVSRYFKLKSGNNFWDYLNAYRTDCATKLLADTDLNVSEICFKCGFNNLSNFNKVFKARMLTTPSEFRLSMAEKGPAKK